MVWGLEVISPLILIIMSAEPTAVTATTLPPIEPSVPLETTATERKAELPDTITEQNVVEHVVAEQPGRFLFLILNTTRC
jgi:hypothetical protein